MVDEGRSALDESMLTGEPIPVEGLSQVQVDIPAKQVCVTYDPTLVKVDRVQEILEEEDYPVASAA